MRPLNSTLLLNADASPVPVEMKQSFAYRPVVAQGVSA